MVNLSYSLFLQASMRIFWLKFQKNKRGEVVGTGCFFSLLFTFSLLNYYICNFILINIFITILYIQYLSFFALQFFAFLYHFLKPVEKKHQKMLKNVSLTGTFSILVTPHGYVINLQSLFYMENMILFSMCKLYSLRPLNSQVSHPQTVKFRTPKQSSLRPIKCTSFDMKTKKP